MRRLARGAAVQRDLASRALLGPLVAFVIGATRLARRVVASSGTLLKCLGLFDVVSSLFLGKEGVWRHKMRETINYVIKTRLAKARLCVIRYSPDMRSHTHIHTNKHVPYVLHPRRQGL